MSAVRCACIGALLFTGAAATHPAMAYDPAHRDDLSATDKNRVAAVLSQPPSLVSPHPFEIRSAGAATLFGTASDLDFETPAANLTDEAGLEFELGKALFEKLWVESPASTKASDGLGPLYNARSCSGCHEANGRGAPPDDSDRTSMLVRLSVPGPPAPGQLRVPEPVYGGQFHPLAITGIPAEGRFSIEWTEQLLTLTDGTEVQLRSPRYRFHDLAYGPLHKDTLTSGRIAPPMIGLGLLEAIHPGDLLANADPDDRDGDGISGQVHWVTDIVSGEKAPGRFGWKATHPSVVQQSADAFLNDLGLSTPLLPMPQGDCTAAQILCRAAPDGEQTELGTGEAPETVLTLTTLYAANLAVPQRRNVEAAEVLRGKALFQQIGCAGCHIPGYVTSRAARADHLRFQLIWPYTDLLLHDMGEGLADQRPVGAASGREWRTPPLWGIGLSAQINGNRTFLHDGRARNLLEAILWHGGEAQKARDAVTGLSSNHRSDLLAFLESL